MFRSIIGGSATLRLLVIAVAGVLLAVGIAGMCRTTIEALADFGPVRVDIQTEYQIGPLA
jgi:Cu/Ag efflux pump CusA